MIYDEANKRTAQEEVVDARTPGAKFYLILNFFDDHTQYKIDTTDRKCYKGTIPDNEQWRPFGVPTGATFVQQVRNNSVDWCTLRGFFFIVPSPMLQKPSFRNCRRESARTDLCSGLYLWKG